MTRESTPIRERIRNRMLVREQTPMKGRELIGYLTLSALILLPTVFGLWQQNDFVRTRFEIESRRQAKLALQERHRCLRIERATLESLDRIGGEARKAGLLPRDEARLPSYIVPSNGRSLRAWAPTPRGAVPGSSGTAPALPGADPGRAALDPPSPADPKTQPRLIGAGVTPPL